MKGLLHEDNITKMEIKKVPQKVEVKKPRFFCYCIYIIFSTQKNVSSHIYTLNLHDGQISSVNFSH